MLQFTALNVRFHNNQAPYFTERLPDVLEFALPMTPKLIEFPSIQDDDSEYAYISSLSIIGAAECARIIQVNNYL